MAKADDPEATWPYYEASRTTATGAWAEKRRLAAAMRRVIEQLVSVDAPADELRATAHDLERFAETLSRFPRRTIAEGYAESANAGDVHAIFDRSPMMGLSNPLAPPLDLESDGERVTGTGVFGTAFEGPPGCVHGGFVAAAFDEVLGFAQSMTHSPGMTGTLVVKYRLPTPLHTILRFEAVVDKVETRKIFASGKLYAGDLLTAEAEGIFVKVDRERFLELMRREAEMERGRQE